MTFLSLHSAALTGGEPERAALAEAMFAVLGAHDADGLSVRTCSNYPGPGSLWSLVGPRGEELARLHSPDGASFELLWVRSPEDAARLRKEELERGRQLRERYEARMALVVARLLSGADVAYRAGCAGGVLRLPGGGADEVVSAHRALRRCGLSRSEARARLTWEGPEAWDWSLATPALPEWLPFRLGLEPLARLVIAAERRPRSELVTEAVEHAEQWLGSRASLDVEAARCLAYDLTIDAPAVSALLYALVGFMRDEIGWQSHAARAVALERSDDTR